MTGNLFRLNDDWGIEASGSYPAVIVAEQTNGKSQKRRKKRKFGASIDSEAADGENQVLQTGKPHTCREIHPDVLKGCSSTAEEQSENLKTRKTSTKPCSPLSCPSTEQEPSESTGHTGAADLKQTRKKAEVTKERDRLKLEPRRKSKNKFKSPEFLAKISASKQLSTCRETPGISEIERNGNSTAHASVEGKSRLDSSAQGERNQLNVNAESSPRVSSKSTSKKVNLDHNQQKKVVKSLPAKSSVEAAQASPVHERHAPAARADGSREKTVAGRAGNGMMDQFERRLKGSKFRWLNELLYTSTGEQASTLMESDPGLFQQYHQGFQQQTKGWPRQPIQEAIMWLKSKPKAWKVADFGCGDGALAEAVPQGVVSLDLVASKPWIVACNMSHTPLDSGEMDAVIFCLALMGTDYPSFLEEATRVLKQDGKLWIAEVRSRFANKKREDFAPFIAALDRLGFELLNSIRDTLFVVLVLRRVRERQDDEIEWPKLEPCVYKRR